MLLALPPVERLRPVSVDVLHALRVLLAPAAPVTAAPVAIVAIDEETYRSPRFADTPQAMWTRDIARVVSALVQADVRVIGFDVVYPTSVDRFLPGFDRDFLLALRRGGQQDKIVLGKVQHQQHPIAPFAGQRLAVGGEDNIRSLNLVTDADEIVRRVPLFFDGEDGREPGLALELAQRALGVATTADGNGVRLGDWRLPGAGANSILIDFTRPGALPDHSLQDLVACLDTPRAAAFFRENFAGKTVLLGGMLDIEDRKITSLRWATQPERPAQAPRCASEPRHDLFDAKVMRDSIPGVLVHAAAVANLIARTVLQEVPRPAAHALDAVMAAVAAGLVLVLAPTLATVAVAGLLLLWLVVAYLAFGGGLVLPVVTPALAAAMALAMALGWRFAVTDRDKRVLRQSFALYLAPALIDRMADSNRPPALGGETREVTVFFSDLAGFSSMSEKMAPAETVRVMNAYLGAMTDEIEARGGMVDKYIGDAIVALFGAPLDQPDHAARGAAAALACRARLNALNAELGLAAPLRQRIGLNSGPALVGNIGSARRFNYTAMGDVVNLAARLEGANKTFGTDILAAEATAMAAPGMTWLELDAVRVVGRGTPVRLFTPLDMALPWAEAYAAALVAFRDRNFAEAAARLIPFQASDKAAARLYDRAVSLAAQPPPPGWESIFDLTEK